ncbi:MAG: hypothetical protein AABY11_02600, partial [archaeon]
GDDIPMNEMFKKGPTDAERWMNSFHDGVKKWPRVEHERAGTGDAFLADGAIFAESQSTMRDVRVRVKLGKTQQQRAIQLGAATLARNPNASKEGWVDVTIAADTELQNAITLARQAYMENQRVK